MSNLFKIVSLTTLTSLLIVAVTAGSAQDKEAKAATALGTLPNEEGRVLTEPVGKEDARTEDKVGSEVERRPVPSAAVEESPGSDLLPVVPPVTRYEGIWQNSPFELEAAPDVVTTAKESFAKDYALSGMLKQGDQTIVYIVNRKTGETHKVTSEGGGEGGFKLQSLQGSSNNVRDVEATIEKDGEVARLVYDKTLIAAASGAAMKNHPRTQRDLDNAQNPRQPGASSPQDRSAAAAAARARQAETAGDRKGGAAPGGMGSRLSAGSKAGTTSAAPSAGAAHTSSSRRRIVLPKAPAPQESK